jgi:hypothetical protein
LDGVGLETTHRLASRAHVASTVIALHDVWNLKLI